MIKSSVGEKVWTLFNLFQSFPIISTHSSNPFIQAIISHNEIHHFFHAIIQQAKSKVVPVKKIATLPIWDQKNPSSLGKSLHPRKTNESTRAWLIITGVWEKTLSPKRFGIALCTPSGGESLLKQGVKVVVAWQQPSTGSRRTWSH